jgi:predicted ribosomally synthesized peptide with SipW-like signal peptide
MTRLGYLVKNPKRTLGALATLMVAAGLTVGSGAYFTDTESSTLNSASAADFGLQLAGSTDSAFDASVCDTIQTPDCDVQGVASDFTDAVNGTPAKTTFDITNLVPADDRTYTRRFAIKNNGDVPADYRVKALVDAASDSALVSALEVKVTDVSATDAADHEVLSDAGDTLADLDESGEIDPDQVITYELEFTLPDSGTDQTADLADTGLEATIQAIANDTNKGTPADADFS